jgi:hypothetical protein
VAEPEPYFEALMARAARASAAASEGAAAVK